MGVLGDYVVFFSKELTPTKPPENVQANWLTSTAINVTWTPLSLFEARGFPQYRIALTPFSNHDQRRQIESTNVNVAYTNASFAVFTNLVNHTRYTLVVGVTTGESHPYMDSNPIDGMTSVKVI